MWWRFYDGAGEKAYPYEPEERQRCVPDDLDDDFNVPDTMEDVEQLILERGEIQIESAKNQGEKVEVRGRLDFRVLYRTPGRTGHDPGREPSL